MNFVCSTFLTAILFSAIFGEQVRYDGFKVYRLNPKSKEAVEFLRTLENGYNDYDFWSPVRGVNIPVDIMVPPHHSHLNNEFSNGFFEIEEFIPDVQKLIDNEKLSGRSLSPRAMEWSEYHTLDEINSWLKNLNDVYGEITLFTAGRSYEGRDILGVKLSYSDNNKNRSVFVESNIHAREWITSATTTWILNEFLTSNQTRIRRLAESHDWYFVPVFNPDGFAYTHATSRMWRKTRVPYFLCHGVDPNRNWGYHFNHGGSSSYPCSDTYRGPEAFSEPSTRSLSQFIRTIGPELQAYLAIHSYSQLLLLPYGFSKAHLDNYDELYSVGLKAMESLRQVHNTTYTVGNIVEALYVASGGSMDWVKGTFGTRITYTYEVRDKGQYGFLLPADQIIPTAEETLASFITIFEEFDQLDAV